MIDYLFRFTSEAETIAALPGYHITNKWRSDYVVPVRIITQEAQWNNIDPDNPLQIMQEETANGFWLAIAQPETDAALWALPECMIEADRGGKTRQSAILRTRLSNDIPSGARIAPVFEGVDYPLR